MNTFELYYSKSVMGSLDPEEKSSPLSPLPGYKRDLKILLNYRSTVSVER